VTYTLLIVVDPGPKPYDVLITSSIPDTTHFFRKMTFNLGNFVGVDSPNLYYYVATSPTVNAGAGDLKTKFNLPSGSFLNAKGTLVARMPTVGLQDNVGTMDFASPEVPPGFAGGALDIDPAYLKTGHPVHSESPADYDVTGNDDGVIYAPPNQGKFQSAVVFTDTTYGMASAQIQANSPSNGVFKDQSFQWLSTDPFGLAPYLSLVQPTALDQRSSDDFLSRHLPRQRRRSVDRLLSRGPPTPRRTPPCSPAGAPRPLNEATQRSPMLRHRRRTAPRQPRPRNRVLIRRRLRVPAAAAGGAPAAARAALA
jgi:hypothetical protein